jgi:hypothetical protein
MLKHHPEDAFFRYHHFLEQFQNAGYFSDIAKEIKKLKAILQLAREQRENQVIAAAQKMLHELEEELNSRERMNTLGLDGPEDFDGDHDEPQMETVLDLFNELLQGASRRNKRAHEKPQEKSKPEGPQQMELF